VENVADILTKALAHAKARIFHDPLLFWKGDPLLGKVPGLLMHKDKSQVAEQRGVTSQSARAPVTELQGDRRYLRKGMIKAPLRQVRW
jgi:hypothetical protein